MARLMKSGSLEYLPSMLVSVGNGSHVVGLNEAPCTDLLNGVKARIVLSKEKAAVGAGLDGHPAVAGMD